MSRRGWPIALALAGCTVTVTLEKSPGASVCLTSCATTPASAPTSSVLDRLRDRESLTLPRSPQ